MLAVWRKGGGLVKGHAHGYVYLVAFEEGITKIGMASQDATLRMLAHKRACAYSVVTAFIFNTENERWAERLLLERFSSFRIANEWFLIPVVLLEAELDHPSVELAPGCVIYQGLPVSPSECPSCTTPICSPS